MSIDFICPKCGTIGRWGSTDQGGLHMNEPWCYCNGHNGRKSCGFTCPRSEFWKYQKKIEDAFETEEAYKAYTEAERKRMENPPINTMNTHFIGVMGDRVTVGRAIVGQLTKQEAFVIAAYLVALAEPLPGDDSFEKVQLAVVNA